MNYNKACKYLEFKKNDEINENTIKKQYRMLALTYHPDKNNSPDAKKKFQIINEAYHYLLSYEGYNNSNDISENDYSNILFYFLNSIISEENNFMHVIINKINNLCEDKAIEYLKTLDTNLLFKIYDILFKYKNAFHMKANFIDEVKKIIKEKTKNDEKIILNPKLIDLFEEQVYKLKVQEQLFFIPLWHDELIYDLSGTNLYVNCEPILPENVEIDNQNNIYITKEYNLNEIWNNDKLDIEFNNIIINTRNLLIRSKQTIRYKNCGIPKINTKNPFDASKKSDIFVIINIERVD
jgi:hypothetical protein